MACLIDTGILLRAFDRSLTEREPIRQALRVLRSRQEELFVAAQNLAEFWNVSTRPLDKNGYGLSIERTARRLAYIERFLSVVVENNESFRIWKELVLSYSVSGVAVHDARLVSVMMTPHIKNVLTPNGRDFRRYPEITILTPSAL